MGNCVSANTKKENNQRKETFDVSNLNKKFQENILNQSTTSKAKSKFHSKLRKKTIPKCLKRAVWDSVFGPEVGEALCVCCKRQKIRQIEFACGHIVAESKGGLTTIENLVPICNQCNLSMGSKHLHEFRATYFPK